MTTGEPSPLAYARHTLVTLTSEGFDELLRRSAPASSACRALALWRERSWPLVARRPLDAGERLPGVVPLGLPLPPAWGRERLALVSDASHVRCSRPPVALSELTRLPVCWQEALGQLDRAARALGVRLRVFGSVAWQSLTGLEYLRPESDVDLLLEPRDARQLARLLALLKRWERRTGRRADGEIVFEDSAVAWREWARADAIEVLVKTPTQARLMSRSALGYAERGSEDRVA